jgi:hypothetical protein
MAITIPHSFSDNTIAEASEVVANFTAVENFVNALQAGTNITAGAIQTAAIADGAITSIKLAGGSGTGESDQVALGVQIFS